jgi:acyl-CoA dehydrogenase
MRAVGMAERAVEAMCSRALDRKAFGKPIAKMDSVLATIAQVPVQCAAATAGAHVLYFRVMLLV